MNEVKYNDIFPYRAIVESTIDNGPKSWSSLNVGIYHHGEKIGSYIRNYHNQLNTFHPFIGQDGKWYALYSKDYTATRIMSLPDCKDIGGEERDGGGFCPADYFIPFAYRTEYDWIVVDNYWVDGNAQFAGEDAEFLKKHLDENTIHFAPYAFINGCVWGDDTSWKIQFLDLSQAHEGILTRSDRFGYLEMARSSSRLVSAVEMIEFCGDDLDWAQVRFNFDTISNCYNFDGSVFE